MTAPPISEGRRLRRRTARLYFPPAFCFPKADMARGCRTEMMKSAHLLRDADAPPSPRRRGTDDGLYDQEGYADQGIEHLGRSDRRTRRRGMQIESRSGRSEQDFLRTSSSDITTLTAWAATVATAAPAVPIWSTATSSRSPAILQTHAMATVMSGVTESPMPRKTLPIRLYEIITSMPIPQMRI